MKKKEHLSASPTEFREAAETEFEYLCDRFGFRLSWNPKNPFEAIYSRGGIEIRVTGINYGFGAMASLISDGEEIPFWTLKPKMKGRFLPATNKPQLDDLREYAFFLKNECIDILKGDITRLETARIILEEHHNKLDEHRRANVKGMFFSEADKLWKSKEFDKLNMILAESPYKLSKVWQKRFEYSKKNA